MEKIIIRIKPDATTTIEVNGVKGASCKDLTKGLEEALGAVQSEEKTGEFYDEPEADYIHQS